MLPSYQSVTQVTLPGAVISRRPAGSRNRGCGVVAFGVSYGSLFFAMSGRFSPSRYWAGLAMCLFLVVTAGTAMNLFADAMPNDGFDALAWPARIFAQALGLYVLYLLAAIHVRRLHDMDRSGLYALLAVVTIIGILPLVAMCGLQRGTVGANRFGPDPLLDPDAAIAVFDDGGR